MGDEGRYSRHYSLPGVGESGQKKLAEASVLVIGAGGLGSPVLLYLAAAGVGRLGIIDDDEVALSNLQRQVLHSTETIGYKKVDSAQKRLNGLNDEVEIVTYDARFTPENAMGIFSDGWDVIVDGTDNIPTRYLVDDACFLSGIPWVYGSIYRFRGPSERLQSSNGGPCYRDLVPPAPPPPGSVPSCAEGGVLGVLPGVIGSLQANEALKTDPRTWARPFTGRLLALRCGVQ